MMEIFDISRVLSHDLAQWPGDVGFQYKLNGRIPEGSSVNVGMISMSLHNGSHADARYHFEDDGWTIEQAQLATYIGPAVVVDLSHKYTGASVPQITIDDLAGHNEELRTAPRLLLKTNVWRDSTKFPNEIPVVAPDVPGWLQERGVKLLGLDVPSVDEITSKDLRNHHAIAAAGISIIESLDLSGVSAGRYQFVALPLKIAGGDGSPFRAILWRD
ncbi:MAG: cyclase family protein [Chthoniobacterales bacterium]|nr:cyclase family protein [Chthoniobacterales bacterium]